VIKIDKTDAMYKYLSALQVDDIDNLYLELAKNGRFKLDDIRAYFRADLQPSQTKDIEEKDLECIVDYYADIKKLKHLNSKALRERLKAYKQTGSHELREEIINSQLKDVMHLCINYSTLHRDIDLTDLIQVANLGLLTAIEKYQADKNVDFKDYLVYYVRENIKNNYEEKRNG